MSRINWERPEEIASTARDGLKKHLAEARARVESLDGAYERGGGCQPHLLLRLREARLQVARLEAQLGAAEREVARHKPNNEGRIDNSCFISAAHQKRYDI